MSESDDNQFDDLSAFLDAAASERPKIGDTLAAMEEAHFAKIAEAVEAESRKRKQNDVTSMDQGAFEAMVRKMLP
jgi:hypothetical protein